jgi:hypothetical protein
MVKSWRKLNKEEEMLSVNGRMAKQQFVVPSESSNGNTWSLSSVIRHLMPSITRSGRAAAEAGQATFPDGIVNTYYTRNREAR